ncbi:MAG: hypothetical protein ACRD3R_03510 [Terriglobales bacterium]
MQLPLRLKGTVEKRGQAIFLDNALGKCNICHFNAGANAVAGGANLGNANFNTGVENLPDQPADLTGERVPPDNGFGRPGDGTFNTPPLVESADTGPFFHNNSIQTIEGAVAFYDGESFNNSPSGRFLASIDPNGVGIELDGTQIVEIAAFLRVINALENIRAGIEFLGKSRDRGSEDAKALLERAAVDIADGVRVLSGGGLQPQAVAYLQEAEKLARKAMRSFFFRKNLTRDAMTELEKARAHMIES